MLFYICESHICIYKKSTRLFTVVEPVQIDNRQKHSYRIRHDMHIASECECMSEPVGRVCT